MAEKWKNLHKRVLAYLLALLLTVPVICPPAMASSVVASGNCGPDNFLNNVTWVLTEDGVLTISGTGDMWSFESTNPTWTGVKDFSKAVIESGITSIGDYTFFRCANLTEVAIPETVKAIGKSAFYEDEALVTAALSNSIETIGERAFFGCNALEDITIPNKLVIIEESAFHHCDMIESLEIPDSVTTIVNRAFNLCKGLEYITLGKGVKSIGNYAFYGINL